MNDEPLTWPDWLAAETSPQDRLHAILTAVARCYNEHPDGGMVPTGPHMTITMAETYIAQMLP